jgi:hypothetical protein
VQLGGATYIQGTSNDASSSETEDKPLTLEIEHVLFRCRPRGPCLNVFDGALLIADWEDKVTFSTAGPDRVRVSSSSGRTQVLRWDAARFELVPE